jgi:alpha-galactosidase
MTTSFIGENMTKIKIALIGAGSTVFSQNVIGDILWHEALRDSDLRLVDIDRDRLATAEGMARILCRQFGSQSKVTATTDRRKALDGADVVISTIGVGGTAATKTDLTIPARFGLKQTVGDTLGAGGVFRSVRSVPELLRICADMAELCPDALLLNYSNPMAMHCLAVERATRIKHVGLCHGVVNTALTMRMITAMASEKPAVIWRHFKRPWGDPEREREWKEWIRLGEDPDLSYTCAGINHMAFFLRFESKGRDLYPLLRKAMDIPHLYRFDRVRFDLMRRLGYFMTETAGHTAEYTPYFLKSDAEVARCFLRVSGYLQTCRDQDAAYRVLRREVKAGQNMAGMPYKPSREYCSRIINGLVTGQPYVFNGNVHNQGGALISNLPGDCCVEVPCTADRQGVRPTMVGELPPACAALICTNVNVQDLCVRGILEGNRRYIHQAIMLDPNTASVLTLAEIDRLVEAMFTAHAKRLPKNLR